MVKNQYTLVSKFISDYRVLFGGFEVKLKKKMKLNLNLSGATCVHAFNINKYTW